MLISVALFVLFLLVIAGVPVAAILGVVALVIAEFFAFFPLTAAVGEVSWSASSEFTLLAVPMFILMGEILTKSGMTDRMYTSLDAWFNRLPGGVMHTNIAAATMFAATSGSSVATAATIGTVSLANIERYGYNPRLFLGSLAAGGTLGILIPPSINMVLYGMLANTSVTDLYMASFIPGLVLAGMFSLAIFLACVIKPSWSGRVQRYTWQERILGLRHLLPPLLLFLIVVGTIYGGIATPSEAAAMGVIAALVISLAGRGLTVTRLIAAFEGTMRTTCMIMLIILTAMFLNFCLGSLGVTDSVLGLVKGLELGKYELLAILVAIYLVLGCFMDPLSMMVSTAPIVIPLVVAVGFDPVWFGVVFMILSEAAMITPPIGVNLFVVQSLRKSGEFRDVVIGSLPFLTMMLAFILVITIWPKIVLWLPGVLAK